MLCSPLQGHPPVDPSLVPGRCGPLWTVWTECMSRPLPLGAQQAASHGSVLELMALETGAVPLSSWAPRGPYQQTLKEAAGLAVQVTLGGCPCSSFLGRSRLTTLGDWGCKLLHVWSAVMLPSKAHPGKIAVYFLTRSKVFWKLVHSTQDLGDRLRCGETPPEYWVSSCLRCCGRSSRTWGSCWVFRQACPQQCNLQAGGVTAQSPGL